MRHSPRLAAVAVATLVAVVGCGSPTPAASRPATADPGISAVVPSAVPSAVPTAAASAQPAASTSQPSIVIPSLPAVAPPPARPTTAPATQAAPPRPAGAPHVMVIVMENREYGSVIGDPTAPYINGLANSYGLATQWYGVSHPSLPNYLAMVSGSDWGVHDDGSHTFSGPTLVDQLAARGIGWKAYMEDMPSPCFGGGSSGGYAQKHDPFMSFTSITGNPAQCNRVVPGGQLNGDLAGGTAPPFLFVTPNLCDDGHDCANASADSWLRGEMQAVMGSAWYRQGASVIITWDEGGSDNGCCAGVAAGGHIPTIVVTAAGRRQLNTQGDHYGMLRALEEVYGVGMLGAAASPASGDLRPLLAS